MKTYSYSLQGRRNQNEDTHFAFNNIDGKINDLNHINLLCVFDGHGGKSVSQYLKNNLPLHLLKKHDSNIYNIKNYAIKFFNNIFNYIQQSLITTHPKIVQSCGSTACVCIHYINNKNRHKLWILNVGDTRIVKCNKDNISEQLSLDHKPNEPTEKKRIESMGGKVYKDNENVYRIKNLSLSRAFGDLDCTPYVTHMPSIYHKNINNGDKFIIVGCDGIWDVLSNQDVVDFINTLLGNINYKGNIAKDVAEYAYNKKSSDNITVIIHLL